jgi:hypothetical protein
MMVLIDHENSAIRLTTEMFMAAPVWATDPNRVGALGTLQWAILGIMIEARPHSADASMQQYH